ncbi:MAG: prepilin-type N-terminal cleavage/methylation domain-containing protein [Candidatus Pacebacteria bacterium]|nr:prepilin-type N-terminal cleavage/methylation domain-containing protein [Candidatus Paceibacterota bacterium]
MDRKEKSFTLLELLVVIAIIAILAGVVIASVVDLRQRAKESKGMQFSQNIRTTLSNELTGEWNFDDSVNPGRDSSDYDNNCTVTGATSADGKVRTALRFIPNQFLDCGIKEEFNLTSTGTINVWAKSNRNYPSDSTSTAYRGIISKTANGSISGIAYSIDWYGTNSSRTLRTMICSGAGTNGISISNFDFKSGWNNIIFSWNGSKIFLYINGEQQIPGNQTLNAQILNTTFDIGRAFKVGYWDGWIDEVQIYNRALTAHEIQQLYVQSKGRHLVDK